MDTKHYKEIDICRGICVVLVIMGHVFLQTDFNTSPTINNSYLMNSIYFGDVLNICGKIIYTFHMYLFFLLAGFVSIKILTLQGNNKKIFVIKRTKRLIIPYITMGMVYLPLRIYMARFARNVFSINDFWKILIGSNPDGALWFLYALYVNTILVLLILNVLKYRLELIMIPTFVMYILSYHWSFNLSIINNIMKYTFFFILGIYLRKNYNKIEKIFLKKRIFIITLSLFIISNATLFIFMYDYIYLKIIACLSGMLLMLIISKQISCQGNTRISSILELFSLYSMDIYIFSEPFKVIARIISKRLFLSDELTVLVCIATALIIPLLLSKYIIRKNKYLSLLFIGV